MQDTLQRFLFKNSQIRGAMVHLNTSWQTIYTQHAYPNSVANLLGEVLAASVLMANTLKFEGQLIVQLQNQGPIKLLVANCSDKLKISGTARWNEALHEEQLDSALQQGQLVVTVLNQKSAQPYQSIIPLNQPTVALSIEAYFIQSEQLPTKFWFAVNQNQATGMLLQLMPEQDDGAKNEFNLLAASIDKNILLTGLDTWQNQDLLPTLFPDTDIELFDAEPVSFQCSCNPERMEAALNAMSEAEKGEAAGDKPYIEVTCDFCGQRLQFPHGK